jgi:hypothetical protein
MRRRALQLGYSLRLKTEQRELNNLRDFLKWICWVRDKKSIKNESWNFA